MKRLVCDPSEFRPPEISQRWETVSEEVFSDFLERYPRILKIHRYEYANGRIVVWVDDLCGQYYGQVVAMCGLFFLDNLASFMSKFSAFSSRALSSYQVLVNYQDVIDEIESMLNIAESEMEDV